MLPKRKTALKPEPVLLFPEPLKEPNVIADLALSEWLPRDPLMLDADIEAVGLIPCVPGDGLNLIMLEQWAGLWVAEVPRCSAFNLVQFPEGSG